ncbi:F-box protein At3g07870-like [Solanum tuberosum]|uniref:F-box family protein n=1 Tax=Solanum tuberosum TaxID=4113 RepID=M1DXE5_SOLTU|nr:PREDICTED: F-box protein At3g07870-like [Solanum tuberosum]
MYYKRSSYFPSILLSINDSVRLLVELKDDVTHPLNRAIMLSPRFHLPSPTLYKQNLRLISSCNGFICLFNGWRNTVEHSVYISNPLLGEYFEVKLPEWEKRIQRVAYAFCFSETSGQYKVLKSVVSKLEGCPHVSELEVYTIGVDEKWRNVGEVPEPLCRSFCKANVNGIVHWMNSEKNDSIYSFNSWTEEVKSVLAPRGLETSSSCLTLVELGNCLCLCDTNDCEYVDIWWMKEYGIAES